MLEHGNAGLNLGHYSNPAYDDLMRRAAAVRDIARRADLLYEAEAVVVAELPWIPAMHTRSKAMVAPRRAGSDGRRWQKC
ncbi:hypothetical protein MKK58_00590 [Methylobacterium sp. J-078]|uniref:hypothetical protein n=1 Tax=Methylobacterium sp. J-078 TaxID=2836657 RepID=UPI001FBB83F8|nr:hypothetical protein [Methylobacterium sp. J-078]MCJ2043053.1 hypothetical protein [Methylobacterium sp. J-078]